MADYNSDWMSRRQDGELEELEKRISALYSQASREVTEEFTKFTEEFASQEARMLELLAVGKIDDDDFRIWRNNHILQSVRYQSLIKTLTDMMVNTDNSAMAIVSGELPFVIAQSYNFVQALGWDAANQAGYSVGTFTVYNANAVQALIRDVPDLLPSVDNPIDEAWNMSHITREITQGIMQGNTMPQIADRLRRVVGMDENAAMRNARTSFTYAENMGRNESIENLQSRGIPMEKVWSAVMDNRTRQTHRLLNGTTPDKATGLYGVGVLAHPLRFPADKSGDAEEIYNCRCRLSGQFDSSIVDHSNDDELYEQFLRENYPNDYEALLDRDYFNQHTSKPLPRPEVAQSQRSISRRISESPFTPANSIAEAEQYARDNYVSGGFFTLTKHDVSFNGIDLDVANKINERLTTIYDNFDIEKISSLESFGKRDKKWFANHGDAPMMTSNFGNVGLNNILLANADKINKYRDEGQDAFDYVLNNINTLTGRQRDLAETYRQAGRALVDNSVEGMITHEIGHHISYGSMNSVFSQISNNTDWREYATQLSGYANASFGEYVAESFSAYFNGEYDRLQPEIIEIFDDLRRKK